MKIFFLVISILFIWSCKMQEGREINPGAVKVQGGVDVGNMSSSAVPGTTAIFDLPGTWKSRLEGKLLIIESSNLSKIEARKVAIEGLTSLSAEALKTYLEGKYKDREYKFININGLTGVRAELVNTALNRSSDIYLISEGKDIIHIESQLSSSDSDIEEGEKIISTVRTKHNAIELKHSYLKQIDFYHYNNSTSFSLTDECWSDEGCSGSMLTFTTGVLSVDGYIVELGQDVDKLFDTISVDGENIVSPKTKFQVSDAYNPEKHQSQVGLKDNYVYVVKIENGPEGNLLVKIKVLMDYARNKIVIMYKKLVAIKIVERKSNTTPIQPSPIENPKDTQEWQELSVTNKVIDFSSRSGINNFLVQDIQDPSVAIELVFGKNDKFLIRENPFGNKRGFINFGNNAEMDLITKDDIVSKEGHFLQSVAFKEGDIIALYQENYAYKTIVLIKVFEHRINSAALISTRFIYYGKAK